jgi:AcrR family transcriptional regulator
MAAARRVFGRDGYTRASIDAIAAEAGVSTRTIYNHFDGKEQLFSAVLEASATQVADAFLDQLSAISPSGDDPRPELVAMGAALIRQSIDFPDHFAMVRQIGAEDAHFPIEVIKRWRAAGPRRVESAVMRRLWAMGKEGRLAVPDASRAARHFIALVASETARTQYPHGPRATEAKRRRMIEAAVEAFLHGYGG